MAKWNLLTLFSFPALLVLFGLGGCGSSDDTSQDAGGAAANGASPGVGSGTGGTSSGTTQSSGGTVDPYAATGGLIGTTGGVSSSAGGSSPSAATGGSGVSTGGQGTATGGAAVGTGGVAVGTGGADVGTGGDQSGGGTGGTDATGGTGGSDVTGGAAGTGGQESTGGETGTGGVSDPDARRMLLRDEGNSALHYVDLGDSANNWHTDIPAGRDLQLVGAGRVLIGTDNGYQEYDIASGALVDEFAGEAGTIAARRLRNGNTLLVGADWQGQSGIVLVEVDSSGNATPTITYAGFDYVRLVRETPSGTFLVTSDRVVFEGDANGDIIWQVTIDHDGPHSWMGVRLASGDTVVSTGYAASLQVPVRMDLAAKMPLSIAGPIPSPKSRVARPAASPIMYALFNRPTGTGCLR